MTTSRRIAPGVQITPGSMMHRAREATGLDDFGDRWFEEPLSGLIALINREAALESGDTPGVRTIVRYLADRLKLVDYLKRHPEVLDERVDVAGVIIAHGRGGSTLTQRLLTASSADDDLLVGLITPVPLPGEPPGDFSGRHRLGRDWIEEFKTLFPEYAHIHPMDPMAADEEVVLMDRSFLSMMYTCYFNLPGYPTWLMAQDHRPAYRELKVWLQLLQHQEPRRSGKKWLLKAVHHLMSGGVPVLLETFPEAKAIITHRNLENVIGSWCSAWGAFPEELRARCSEQRWGRGWFSGTGGPGAALCVSSRTRRRLLHRPAVPRHGGRSACAVSADDGAHGTDLVETGCRRRGRMDLAERPRHSSTA
jgi:hypothetical protein